ncbi:MAG TPA: hypothetical protein VHK88_02955 [Aquihabitans sp.]|nr:hypothetical protein [Aquihabitans sp.]
MPTQRARATVARGPLDVDDPGAQPAEAVPAGPRRRPAPRLDTVVAVALGVVGLRLGLAPLHDNSFLTHLATGRLILDEGGVPRTDPYSFTALGDPWTVQSWGASVLYAGIEQVAGLGGIRLVVGLCSALLAVLAWELTRPAGRLVGRLVVVVPVVAVGSSFWSPRPLIFGLVFLAVVLLAAEGRFDPRWLVPVLWVWANVHGSFPLGLAALATLAVGRALDRGSPRIELRALAWAGLGTLLAAVNPLGPKLLLFPLQLLQRREAFAEIVEWKPPQWQSWGERAFALQLVLAVVVLLVRGRRWRAAVPLVVFGVAALTSMRNIPQASLVIALGTAAGLADLGTIDGARRTPIARPVVAVLGVLALLLTAGMLTQPHTDLSSYPTRSAAWMRGEGLLDLESRVVTRDYVGNYFEARFGPDEVRTYVDDRVDMFPLAVIRDYTSLLDPGTDYQAVLERARATAVLWDRDSDLGRWLERTSRWRIVHRDADWLVALPAT